MNTADVIDRGTNIQDLEFWKPSTNIFLVFLYVDCPHMLAISSQIDLRIWNNFLV